MIHLGMMTWSSKMIKLFEMTTLLLLVACGQVGPELDDGSYECEPHNELYSHTVLFCDGYETENIEDVFEVCNPRQPWSERNPCVTCDLMEFEEGCDLRHVCFDKRAQWELNDGE